MGIYHLAISAGQGDSAPFIKNLLRGHSSFDLATNLPGLPKGWLVRLTESEAAGIGRQLTLLGRPGALVLRPVLADQMAGFGGLADAWARSAV